MDVTGRSCFKLLPLGSSGASCLAGDNLPEFIVSDRRAISAEGIRSRTARADCMFWPSVRDELPCTGDETFRRMSKDPKDFVVMRLDLNLDFRFTEELPSEGG